jgi:formylglycine-generating enzyme required for sulfatase activity
MVRISGKNYELGKYEVTQYQWRAVMGNNPSKFTSCGDTCPVEQVSWNDIQEYLQKLNAKTSRQYRLPSKAEWEYACYGGSQTEYCGGNDINAVAWYEENSNSTTHPVGQKQANGYGLYDMSGNVGEYRREQGFYYLLGGSWAAASSNANPAKSVGFEAKYGSGGGRALGFRLARTIP